MCTHIHSKDMEVDESNPYRQCSEVRYMGDYGFIGRVDAIQKLEQAVQKESAAILIHGVTGVGKTSLLRCFMRWMFNTDCLRYGGDNFWFQFEDIYSAEQVIERMLLVTGVDNIIPTNIEGKIEFLANKFNKWQHFIVWDNFESAFTVTGVNNSARLTERDKELLIQFIHMLRGGQSKVFITSISPENWLPLSDCQRVQLNGLEEEDLWSYCIAVSDSFGLAIDKSDKKLYELLNRLDGNPLSVRVALFCLANFAFTPQELLATLDNSYDEKTTIIYSLLSVFIQNIDNSFTRFLSLLGLHEYFIDTTFLSDMTGNPDDNAFIEQLFDLLSKTGLCRNIHGPVNDLTCEAGMYSINPALGMFLQNVFPASEDTQHAFVYGLMKLVDIIIHEKFYGVLAKFGVNLQRAIKIAKKMDMEEELLVLMLGSAVYTDNHRQFAETTRKYGQMAETAKSYGNMEWEAVAYHQMGNIAYELHDFEAALVCYKQSLEINLKTGNERMEAHNYHQLGNIAYLCWDFATAAHWYKQALPLKLKQIDNHDKTISYPQPGMIAINIRDFSFFDKWCKQMLGLIQLRGDEADMPTAYPKLPMLQSLIGDTEDSSKINMAVGVYFSRLMQIEQLHTKNDKKGDTKPSIYHHFGMITKDRNDFDTATKLGNQLLEISLKLDNDTAAAEVYRHIGSTASRQMDYDVAIKWLEQSLAIYLRHGNEYVINIIRQEITSIKARSLKDKRR